MAHDRPNLVFLMETKNKENVVDRVRRRLKFQYSVIINPIGIVGGLALLWNEEVTVEVEYSSRDLIDITYRDPSSGILMRISFLHASTNYQERI